MPLEDKTLICAECGREFVYTVAEQQAYAQRGFTHEPKRCRECRIRRRSAAKRRPGRRGNARTASQRYQIVCADCGTSTTVPFKPDPDRPVYCQACYRKRRPQRTPRPAAGTTSENPD
jgi:CxxC-x17-CxxC domain-containing protein